MYKSPVYMMTPCFKSYDHQYCRLRESRYVRTLCIELLHLIGIAYSPTTASQFLHARLELCYRFCVWFCLELMCPAVKAEPKAEVFKSLWSIYLTLCHIYFKP